MGKEKQITIDRKNKVITQLKQERSDLLSEVGQYKNVQKITDSASSTSIAITDLKKRILDQVDSSPTEPVNAAEEADESEEESGDEEAESEEGDDEKKIFVLAGDQPARTHRIADLLR